jgi:hypothetical protein
LEVKGEDDGAKVVDRHLLDGLHFGRLGFVCFCLKGELIV